GPVSAPGRGAGEIRCQFLAACYAAIRTAMTAGDASRRWRPAVTGGTFRMCRYPPGWVGGDGLPLATVRVSFMALQLWFPETSCACGLLPPGAYCCGRAFPDHGRSRPVRARAGTSPSRHRAGADDPVRHRPVPIGTRDGVNP